MNHVEVKESTISGKGLFANALIPKGSVVLAWKPKILTKQEANKLPVDEQKHYLYPDGDKMIWMQPPERFVNHSCEPNTHVEGQCDVASRDIQPGEEITSDYMDLETENFRCHCGSAKCRNPVS
ncbi:SET domain-containing protein-lysine N-methyltransferase [Candidatus Nomurabacteria bacterium]|nr:SET domain-containing protein-lysine N-methyltransferase [Candidatus Nomurabacteria bacterium]